MRIAAWNLNNQVGYVEFKPEAALAACELEAEILILTEYYPQENHDRFLSDLSNAGYRNQILSKQPKTRSNRTLVASRVPIDADSIPLPSFDEQLPANVVSFIVRDAGLRVVGMRVPYYTNKEDLVNWTKSWDWIESMSADLVAGPALIIGDLNVSITSRPARGGEHFRRLLNHNWTRAVPRGSGSYWLGKVDSWSEIDQAMASPACKIIDAEYKTRAGRFELAGTSASLSDHAALSVECQV
jgi:hypothetical protein